MTTNTYLLIAAALLPAIVLCIYVFKKDRVEKEPLGLLLQLLLLGVASCFVAAGIGKYAVAFIDNIFRDSMVVMDGEIVGINSDVYYPYQFLYYFVGVALVEELVKWGVLVSFTKKSEEFNCLFDGMLYAIFVSLGFAAFENVLYVLQYGWTTALVRSITSVPGHMFFAVMMGYHYSSWHILSKARKCERKLKANGLIDAQAKEFDPKKSVVLSILIPVAAHGFYDFCCTTNSTFFTIVFYVFVFLMYLRCFKTIKRVSKQDAFIGDYISALLVRKYPSLEEKLTVEEETEPDENLVF